MWNTDLIHLQRRAQRTIMSYDGGSRMYVFVCASFGYGCAYTCHSWCKTLFLLYRNKERRHYHHY